MCKKLTKTEVALSRCLIATWVIIDGKGLADEFTPATDKRTGKTLRETVEESLALVGESINGNS